MKRAHLLAEPARRWRLHLPRIRLPGRAHRAEKHNAINGSCIAGIGRFASAARTGSYCGGWTVAIALDFLLAADLSSCRADPGEMPAKPEPLRKIFSQVNIG